MSEDKKKTIKETPKESKLPTGQEEVKEDTKVGKSSDAPSLAIAREDKKATDDKSAEIKIEKVTDKSEPDFNFDKIDGLEELPDEVKKKLEKRKSEKKPDKGKVRKKKKKVKKRITSGRAYIKATYNNTIVSLTDLNGNVLSWASAGIAGFKGPKKSTPYAAQIITRIAVEKAREVGLKDVCVYVKGVGTGRESAVRALNANGLIVTYIKDVTPVPHNGCRKRKPRRV